MMQLFGSCWHEPSAGLYYRVRVPMRAIEKLGLAQTWIDDPFSDSVGREQRMFFSDLLLFFLIGGKEIHHQLQVTSEMVPKPDISGRIKNPPVTVFDVDDDIEMISPLNPKFCTLGTRMPDGTLLDPRADLGIQMAQNEGPVYLWKHGQQTIHGQFNAGDNIIRHAMVRKTAATCDAITCTGQHLAERIKHWGKRTFVYPNSLLFDDVVKMNINTPPDEVRVMWQGGYSHYADFYPLKAAFTKAAKLMPQIKWVVFGQMYSWVFEYIPAPRVEFHGWVKPGTDLQAYWLKLASLSADISIAPLVDTVFNRCKSAIKFYEAAALGVPTLAQNTGPYREDIKDGENALLFTTPDEFVEKLEKLVKDVEYRKALGKRGEEWVHEYRDATRTVIPLFEFYERLCQDVNDAKLAAA